jgi:predicted LPLAT superfamily acyltransferase
MNTAWQRLPERSNAFWLGAITWIALHLGSGIVRLLLYPITGYFVVFRNATLPATRRYLRRALGREPGWSDLFRLYHTFACTLVDRLYVLAGRDGRLQLSLHGLDVLERHAASGQGCLLVGSHLGSFEIIRALGRTRRGLRVKALMDVEATPQIARLYQSLNPALHEDIIPVGRPGALVGLDRFTADGGMLALLGDRCLPGDKRVACDFMGEPAWFPQTPAALAQVLRVPMVLFVCLNTGWGRYALHFEELAEDRPVPRADREAEAGRIMQRYADRLAHYARLAPFNWFNFHDVWQVDG